ncbi:hypothetical protein C8Q80DRAFT_843689 [Daedaleopsis nitida]|nr:hypothetical protein C8Q80DRAFT_843689 [Daedaleopsis nitida]
MCTKYVRRSLSHPARARALRDACGGAASESIAVPPSPARADAGVRVGVTASWLCILRQAKSKVRRPRLISTDTYPVTDVLRGHDSRSRRPQGFAFRLLRPQASCLRRRCDRGPTVGRRKVAQTVTGVLVSCHVPEDGKLVPGSGSSSRMS